MPKSLIVLLGGVAVCSVALASGCTKDLELGSKRFACETPADCPGQICDPVAKVCKLPGEDVANLIPGDVPTPDAPAPDGAAPDAVADTPGPDAVPDAVVDVDLGPQPTCQQYCDAVMAACGDGSSPVTTQYASTEQCLSICETSFYDGADVDVRGYENQPTGNTIACRLDQANKAAASYSAAVQHCDGAGFSGGNICGSWCDLYCQLDTAHCGNFASSDECSIACAGLADTGLPTSLDGDTVQCRLYHYMASGLDKPGSADTHCGHALVASAGDVCGTEVLAPSCSEYCAAVTTNCTGVFQQFSSTTECESACGTLAKLDAGLPYEKDTNTIGCRLFHARAAEHDPIFHCPAAGIYSNDTCGTWCDNYCHLTQSNCTGANELFTDADACQTTCAGYSDLGSPGDPTGDSVQCRAYHILVAGLDASSATTHCPHGQPDGFDLEHCQGDIPAPTCEAYCTQVMANCPAGGANEQFANETACLSYCNDQAQLDAGSFQDSDRNTIGCRLNAARNASVDPDTWCVAAGNTGGGVCGSFCDNYCHLAQTVCTDDPAPDGLYANADECILACAGFPTTGAIGDTSGNSVQCRIYHAIAASLASPDVHCPHAGPDGANQCVDP